MTSSKTTSVHNTQINTTSHHVLAIVPLVVEGPSSRVFDWPLPAHGVLA
ncbi:hypothetical protein SNOG_16167 [Parastagonospora nodorum SN15]|uniref:Uncharacterized protein n=1 Tax=Phaeosphaeria nodorum (strain SN15 / ATCC MYA-4574 / FGSC 10173) TaxID=321614 RepID=Q0TW52_PHANO|nr:hypothetical protein SNOG_16167 [Parastagonospora nodorum SN15]EAT76351.1 hypothetical protein SNOG_16167 [Parastagonospora nodorum SN15]